MRGCIGTALFAFIVGVATTGAQAQVPTVAPARADSGGSGAGKIAGRVIDQETGRPLSYAQVVLDSGRVGAATDLDGRFILANVRAGRHRVTVRLIGFRPARQDSIVVAPGRTAIANFALTAAASQLAATVVTAEAPKQTRNDASLLAVQKNAASVSDGISAEAMAKSPSSNAADAITRVPGVSVIGGRFTVVRGLAERYSNTLLNGAELPSPEPTRKIVPLDIFPASLLESIVTSKTGTPDKPGDFTGGSVEIKTKEFPEERVIQMSLGVGGNSLATGGTHAIPQERGAGYFGFGGADRELPSPLPGTGLAPDRFAQAVNAKWVPPTEMVGPDLKASLSVGDQTTLFGGPLGVIVAGTYNLQRSLTPDRLFVFNPSTTEAPTRSFSGTDAQTTVDLGAIANISYRLRPTQKIGFKNTYTRSTENYLLVTNGVDLEKSPSPIRGYQTRYVLRDLWQSQLSGDHLLGWLFDSRLEWRGTLARARRGEPDTRQAPYGLNPADGSYGLNTVLLPNLQARTLEDRMASFGSDWSVPLRWGKFLAAQLKLGGLYRERTRQFDSYLFYYRTADTGVRATQLTLTPDRLFAPELMGPVLKLDRIIGRTGQYVAFEKVKAVYGLLDIPLGSRLRVLAGARYESWLANLTLDPLLPTVQGINKAKSDLLGSMNLTIKLDETSNLRAAWFSSVSRPDPREISPDFYSPVLGECDQVGQPTLRRARADSYDLRWEKYPAAGEILSVSAFFKTFDSPIVETTFNGASGCNQSFANARLAINTGLEFEARRTLTFLPGGFKRLNASLNVTVVKSKVWMPSDLGLYPADLELAGQSPWLVNASLGYESAQRTFSATVLGNWFGDRIVRYGQASRLSTDQAPNLYERGRFSLDAKLSRRFNRMNWTLGARNLMNVPVVFYQEVNRGVSESGRIPQGINFSMGMGYDF